MMKIKKILIKIYNLKAKFIFKEFGDNSKIYWPGEIQNGKYMSIGSNCYIKKYSWIQAIKITNNDPQFRIGNNSHINRQCQIVISQEMFIGDYVAIGDNVFIADCTHPYQDVSLPIVNQPVVLLPKVSIGDGSWIGRNASIMGCKIGKNCVIGNSAFVTNDIPDYCVAVGNPAKIVKRYSFEKQEWLKTDKDGNFLEV